MANLISRMFPQDEGTSERIIATFNQARDDEYGELLEQCENLLRELEKESILGKFTFAELEENEDELQKLARWYQKIIDRDFFGASLHPCSDEKLEECRARLELFSKSIFQRSDEAPHG